MGALSSWCMLAVTHHLIVQLAARLAGVQLQGWFVGYELLGDDLVIFNKEVASKYLLLCSWLGLEINQAKSIISESRPVLEFAKRTSLKGVDVSALSWKQFFQSNSLYGRLAISQSLLTKGYHKSPLGLLILGNKRYVQESYNCNTFSAKHLMLHSLVYKIREKVITLKDVVRMLSALSSPLDGIAKGLMSIPGSHLVLIVSALYKDNKLVSLPDLNKPYMKSLDDYFKAIFINSINDSLRYFDDPHVMNNKLFTILNGYPNNYVQSSLRHTIKLSYFIERNFFHPVMLQYFEVEGVRNQVGSFDLQSLIHYDSLLKDLSRQLDINVKVDRKVKISNEIQVLSFINKGKTRYLDRIIFDLRKAQYSR